ncbi:DUF4359 domain-containing protein [Spirulina major CS-329]|uniref:DUF4359 domain-containing protein n=1 Tax=Spirulina TaxID=1154 RepID=UPI00232A8F9C|nr:MULTISPECIES: DUF4359 domain-containing protein [Spirulina]MDB9495880.1 DUF4359 domain-containing protein [Spirulina subsalsa CS-330]MDB9502052.1 DUF4359 domain-containing protein [Spirulina major CS-329]
MKLWQATVTSAGIMIGVLGAGLTMTNPGRSAYEDYAVEQLTLYLNDNLCQDLPEQLRQFSQQCQSLGDTLLDTARPQLQQLLNSNTDRENYLLFSIYRTELALPPMVTGYQFETLGILNQFYIYRMEKKQ